MRIATSKAKATLAVNNHSTSDLGKHQIQFSSQVYNPISNDSIILDLITSDKPKRYQLVTAGYLKRLNSYGTSASILFSHSKDDPKLTDKSDDNKTIIFKGRLDQYAVLNNDYSVKLELAAESRDTERHFDGKKTTDYDYVMGSLGAKIKIVDSLGVENWFFPYFNWTLNKVSYSKDSKEPRNFDKDFNFFIVDFYRDQPLPRKFSLFLKASYQNTNKLLPSEHRYSINTRGYESGLVSADQGISGKLEMRYTTGFESPKIKEFIDLAQFFAFYDVSHFIDHNKTADRKEHKDAVYFDESTLSGAGIGMRLFLPYEFYAEAVGEFPLMKSIKVNGQKHTNKPIFRFLVSKEFKW